MVLQQLQGLQLKEDFKQLLRRGSLSLLSWCVVCCGECLWYLMTDDSFHRQWQHITLSMEAWRLSRADVAAVFECCYDVMTACQ